jgi:hypothetical protein
LNPAYDPLQRGVQMLAGVCDGAATRDNHGFNGGDADFGRAMALKDDFSPRMAIALKALLPKYSRQLGDALVAQIKAVDIESATRPQASAPLPPQADLTGPIDVETLLHWSDPQSQFTRNGDRMVRKAKPDARFWALWKTRKEEIKSLGLTIFKNDKTGEFEATLWPKRGIEPQPSQAQQQNVKLEPVTLPDWVVAKLLPYQVEGAGIMATSLKCYGAALDASDLGTGKTYMAIAAAVANDLDIAVICPVAVKSSWKKAAAHFSWSDRVFVENYEQYRNGNTKFCTATKVPRLKKDGTPQKTKQGKPIIDVVFAWSVPANTVIVWDECHRTGGATQNQDMHVACTDSGAKQMLLSGTAADSPLQMKAIGYALKLFQKPSHFWKFCFSHGCSKSRFGLQFGEWGWDAQKKASHQANHMRSIHAAIFGKGKGNRLCKDQIPGFPETSINSDAIDFENSEEIQRAYDDMKEALSHLDEVEKKDRQGIILTEMLRARQRTEILKTPTLARIAQDAVEEGQSVAIFVNFDATVDKLMELLKTDCVIRGTQTQQEKDECMERFQLGNFPRLSLICPSHSCKDVLQACGRCHRAVDKNATPVWSDKCARIIVCNIRAGGVGVSLHHLGGRKSATRIVFAADTIEEQACEAVERKSANISLLNDGDIWAGLSILNAPRQQELVAA